VSLRLSLLPTHFHVGEKGWLACRYQQRFAQAVVNGLVNGTVVWIGFRLEEYYFL